MTNWDELWQAGQTPWEKGRHAPPLDELLERMDLAVWGGGAAATKS